MLNESHGKQFRLADLEQMRAKETRHLYVHFLDRFVPAVLGTNKWKKDRMTKPLSEYFTISDEAFLLLSYECYNAKWVNQYKVTQQGEYTRTSNLGNVVRTLDRWVTESVST